MDGGGDQHTITALVRDKPGVLARVASMFRRRGFNIVSLAVGNSEQMGLSRMTFVVNGDRDTVDQVTKQLGKLIDVVGISDLSNQETVARELALIKVESSPSNRSEIVQLVQLFRAKSLVIEITGEEDKIDALANLLKPFGIKEMMRTGRVAMVRGQAEGRVGDEAGAGRRGDGSNQGRVDYEGV
jgi:acetolactate synthase-1/3 small subunit